VSADHIPTTLRRLVYERAGGCCEYCLLPDAVTMAPLEVDHIIARKHGGEVEEQNLALCCARCNKHKGSDLATLDLETGELVLLYHPRRNRWHDHFQVSGSLIIAVTAIGHATVRLLQLNHPKRMAVRQTLVAVGLWPPAV